MTIAGSLAIPGLQPESLTQKGNARGAVPCLRLNPISQVALSHLSQKLDPSYVTDGVQMPGAAFPIKKTLEF